ncbi:MAG: HD domain-containing protein [Bacillota bacterium]|nr:HD domain-containing protein [Bacillota bacterium]
MLKELSIPLFDLLQGLSSAMDLVNPALVNHHKRVAYIAHSLARELGFSREEQNNLLVGGMLHDSGIFSLQERLRALQFDEAELNRHAELGYRLLNNSSLFAPAAVLIRFHHVPWQNGAGKTFNGEEVPLGSHVLHLADRIAVSLAAEEPVLTQVPELTQKIAANAGETFVPELVSAFQAIAEREFFWLDIVSPFLDLVLARLARPMSVELDLEGMLDLTNLLSKIIDFRSPFTATHSHGVAATAEALAGLLGLSPTECHLMKIAGYLHDLGKLAVPAEILEKPGRLTKSEFDIVKAHTFYTFRILERIPGLETINVWASFHHERLDGNGYPFHQGAAELPLGSRIVAVSDVFTALTEDRPYRSGLSSEEVAKILEGEVKKGALDGRVVDTLFSHFDEVEAMRKAAQSRAAGDFLRLTQGG